MPAPDSDELDEGVWLLELRERWALGGGGFVAVLERWPKEYVCHFWVRRVDSMFGTESGEMVALKRRKPADIPLARGNAVFFMLRRAPCAVRRLRRLRRHWQWDWTASHDH